MQTIASPLNPNLVWAGLNASFFIIILQLKVETVGILYVQIGTGYHTFICLALSFLLMFKIFDLYLLTKIFYKTTMSFKLMSLSLLYFLKLFTKTVVLLSETIAYNHNISSFDQRSTKSQQLKANLRNVGLSNAYLPPVVENSCIINYEAA